MLQLTNTTPFAAQLAVLPNAQGIDTLYVMVKATFHVGSGLTLADVQGPPLPADVYWEEPGTSSLKYASDLHLGKPATDIVMLGSACAPQQQDVTQLEVALSVGNVKKTVRVFGDRMWRDGRISAPQPFTTMPMVYEKAYGGVQRVEDKVVSAEERNPVGCGYAGTRRGKEMNDVPLPNLEHPDQLIQSLTDQPTPACFGCCAPHWRPRANYAGTYDETWQTRRAPYLPEDFDARFFNVASPDLVYPGYLQGGEPVQITHMHPGGPLHFTVPQIRLTAAVNIAGEEAHPAFALDTLLLEPNALKIGMVWRAAVLCDKKVLKIRDVTIGLSH